MPTNILILCHGMTLARKPKTHTKEYKDFLALLYKQHEGLRQRFNETCYLEYGHQLGTSENATELTQHQKLTAAENHLEENISHTSVEAQNVTHASFVPPPVELLNLGSNWIFNSVRDRMFTHGFTDALYYASHDGETAIRRALYKQVLDKLQPHEEDDEIRLHIIAHSLGATVMFDFLFGLFASDETYDGDMPGFYKDNIGNDNAVLAACAEQYSKWRNSAMRQDQTGKLKLASCSTFGGQNAFFFMRKQALVDKFSKGCKLDARVIGVPNHDLAVWKNFYAVNDILGYPTKALFKANAAIQEFHTSNTPLPTAAHDQYWRNHNVIREIAELLNRTTKTDYTLPSLTN